MDDPTSTFWASLPLHSSFTVGVSGTDFLCHSAFSACVWRTLGISNILVPSSVNSSGPPNPTHGPRMSTLQSTAAIEAAEAQGPPVPHLPLEVRRMIFEHVAAVSFRLPIAKVANNQSCLTELLDLIAILQFNQAKLLSLKTASNPSSRAKIA
jgi:hypothetical protein